MKGVTFGTIHSYLDLNLILAPFTPTPAEPKLNFLEIPGRDGHLDLTEANGNVKYNSREFEFTFTVAPGDSLGFDRRATAVSNALNGLKCEIRLDRDPSWIWEGRCYVSEYDIDKNIGQIKVKAIVNPYKLKNVVRKTFTIKNTSRTSFLLTVEGRMPVVPTFECASGAIIEYLGTAYTLEPGKHKIPAICFKEGTHVLYMTGNVDSDILSMTYREGEL